MQVSPAISCEVSPSITEGLFYTRCIIGNIINVKLVDKLSPNY